MADFKGRKGGSPTSKTWGFFLVAQDMALSHRAKFQLIMNFFRISMYFVVFLPDYSALFKARLAGFAFAKANCCEELQTRRLSAFAFETISLRCFEKKIYTYIACASAKRNTVNTKQLILLKLAMKMQGKRRSSKSGVRVVKDV